MLRISRDEEEYSEQYEICDNTVNFNVFTGLRRCPSVADLRDPNTIEEYRLDTETGIINE